MSLLNPHPRCASYDTTGRPCRRRVQRWGDRCNRCWEQLVRSESVAHRMQLAQELAIPAAARQRLVVDQVMAVRMSMASRPDLSGPDQMALAQDDQVAVLRALASNPRLAPELRSSLSAHHDPLVRANLMLSGSASARS
jgi:hypothetical protein